MYGKTNTSDSSPHHDEDYHQQQSGQQGKIDDKNETERFCEHYRQSCTVREKLVDANRKMLEPCPAMLKAITVAYRIQQSIPSGLLGDPATASSYQSITVMLSNLATALSRRHPIHSIRLLAICHICKDTMDAFKAYETAALLKIKGTIKKIDEWEAQGVQMDVVLQSRKQQIEQDLSKIGYFIAQVVNEKDEIMSILKSAKEKSAQFSNGFKDARQHAQFKQAITKVEQALTDILERHRPIIEATRKRLVQKPSELPSSDFATTTAADEEQLRFEMLVFEVIESDGFSAAGMVKTPAGEIELKRVNSIMGQWLMEFYEKFIEEKRQLVNIVEKTEFVQALKAASADIVKLLAVVSRAVELIAGFCPRDTQLLSVMLRLFVGEMCSEMRGLKLQVSTGEGKSWIVAMLAVMLHIMNSRDRQNNQRPPLIAVVTCNDILAKRDAEDKKMRAFFGLFGLTVDHVEHPDMQRYKAAYQHSHILYGTLATLQAHAAEYQFHGTDNGCARPIDEMVIDEGDLSTNDDVTQERELRLTFNSPGMEELNPLFLLMSFQLHKFLSMPFAEQQQQVEIKKQLAGFIDMIVEAAAKTSTESNADKTAPENSADGNEAPPQSMEQFLEKHTPKWDKSVRDLILLERDEWCSSALQAPDMKNNVHFIQQPRNNAGPMRVVPVDNDNTGCIEQNTQWSNGLHQFVQVLQGQEISPFTLLCAFEHNIGFLRKCRKLTSITGTAGTAAERAFVERIFDIATIVVPRFKHRQYSKDCEDRICETDEEWLECIVEKALEYTTERAVLIITGSIKDVGTIQSELKKHPHFVEQKRDIRTLKEGTKAECVDLSRAMFKGDILIATMLGTRGVDMDYDKQITEGLAHITAFPPPNQRCEEQVGGRVARKGLPGSGCVIIRKLDLQRLLGVDSVPDWSDWRTKRDQIVANRLEDFENSRIPQKLLRDDLYQQMCQIMKQVRAKCAGQKEQYLFAILQFQEHWAFYINMIDHQIETKIEQDKKDNTLASHAFNDTMKDAILNNFDNFMGEKMRQLDSFIADPLLLELFTNCAYMVQTGHLFLETGNFECAAAIFSRAYWMNPAQSEHALYFLAMAYLGWSHALFVGNNNERTEVNDVFHAKALRCLQEAKALVCKRKAWLQGVLNITGIDPRCPLAKQHQRKLELLDAYVCQCDWAFATIRFCDDKQQEHKGRGVIRLKKPLFLEAVLQNYKQSAESNGGPNAGDVRLAAADEQIVIPWEEIRELNKAGLKHFYELDDIAMPKPLNNRYAICCCHATNLR